MKKPYNGRMLWVVEANYASGKKWAWHAEPGWVFHGKKLAEVNKAFLEQAKNQKSTRYRIVLYEPRGRY